MLCVVLVSGVRPMVMLNSQQVSADRETGKVAVVRGAECESRDRGAEIAAAA